MKCPDCVKEGKTSKVYVGTSMSTCMMGPPDYYDEGGNFVKAEDPNIHTTSYSCSNGHHWEEKTRGGKIIE